MNKGISLPVTAIVIIALAVIVLVSLAAFFTQSAGQGQQSISTQSLLAQGCNQLRSLYLCDSGKLSEISVASPSGSQKLTDLCSRQGYDAAACLKFCGCSDSRATEVLGGQQAQEEIPGSGVYGVDIL